MLQATTASSIAQGGAKIKASESNYTTYLQELVVCSECGAPVFLKAKNSIYRQPHWAHFPGTGLNCPLKSKSQPIRADYIPSNVEEEWRQQSITAFKSKFMSLLIHTYSIQGTNYKKPSANFALIDQVKHKPFVGLPPSKQWFSFAKKIPPLARNLTALIECAELFWEDFITMPLKNQILVGFGDYQKLNGEHNGTDYLKSIINDKIQLSKIMLNRMIYLEAVKFIAQTESNKILEWWVCFHYWDLNLRLRHLYVQEWVDAIKQAPIEKYFFLMAIADMAHLPWAEMVEDARKGKIQERPVERLIYNPRNLILQNMYKILTPINVACNKGFGK